MAFCGKNITLEDIRNLLGLTDRTFILRLVDAICHHDATAVLQGLEEIFQAGGNLARLAHELLVVFRHLWLLKSCGTLPNPSELPTTEVETLQRISAQITLEEVQQWFTVLFRGQEDIIRGRLPKLAMEMVLLQMVQIGPVAPISELIARVEALAADAPKKMASPATPRAAKPAGQEACSVSPESHVATPAPRTTWEALATQLKQERPQLASIIAHGSVRRSDPDRFEIEFPTASLYAEMLKEVDRTAQLEQFLQKQIGFRGGIAVLIGEGPSLAERKAVERLQRLEAEQKQQGEAVTHELVREAGKLFDAEIKEVKILKS